MPRGSRFTRTRKDAVADGLKSGYESKIAKNLASRGVEYEYETVKIPYVIPEKKHKYNPDFLIKHNGIFIEGKGKMDAKVREKMASVIAQNPDKDIRLLFMRDNKIDKRSKVYYSDWCEQRGIKYAVSLDGVVPQDWLDEQAKE